MPSDLDDADHWRMLAAEAREVAQRMTDPEAKRVMLFIAEGYKRLALHAEARKSNKK
jgi:hypothetical protein